VRHKIKAKKSKATPISVPAPVVHPKMGPGDLVEFRLRSAAMQAASHNLLMVQEAYQSWIIKTLSKYGLSGRYNINPQTGEMVASQPVEVAEKKDG